MNENLENWVEGSIEIIKKLKEIGKQDKWIKSNFSLEMDEETYYKLSVIIGYRKEFLPFATFFDTKLDLMNYLVKLINQVKFDGNLFYSVRFLVGINTDNILDLSSLISAIDNRLKQPPSQYSLTQQKGLLSTYIYLSLQSKDSTNTGLKDFVISRRVFNYYNQSWNIITNNKNYDEQQIEILALCIISLLWIGTNNILPQNIPPQYKNIANQFGENHPIWEKVVEKIQEMEMLPQLLWLFIRRENIEPDYIDYQVILRIIRKFFKEGEKYYKTLAKEVFDAYIIMKEALEEDNQLSKMDEFIEWCIKNDEIVKKYILSTNFDPDDPDNLALTNKIFEMKIENKEIAEWVYKGFNKLSKSKWQELLTEEYQQTKTIIIPIGKKYRKKFGDKLKESIENLLKKPDKNLQDYSEYVKNALPSKEKRQIKKDINDEFWRKLRLKRHNKMGKFLSFYGKFLSFEGKENQFVQKISTVFLHGKNRDYDEIKWISEILKQNPSILKNATKSSLRNLKKVIRDILKKRSINPKIQQVLGDILDTLKKANIKRR